jgi:dolichol-phosphate mannosyltransferase
MSVVSLVVPVYHNAGSLPDLLSRFQQLAARNSGDRFEFVFVDDGSQDESLNVLQQLQSQESRVRIVKLSRNFGSNAAISAGLSQATGEAVAVIAADLQDPPELIHEMLVKWRSGHRVVLAARESRDDPGLTALFADCFYSLFRRFAIKTMPRHGFDFFLIDRKVCDLINGIQESNPYLMGLILWLGFEPVVLPYHRQVREVRYGRSMWTVARKIKYFIDSFAAFSYVPIRLASLIGISLSVIGLLYAAFVVGARLFFQIHSDGWASLMVVLLVVSGVQMTMTGILGEYLWRNLEETRKRPRFVVDQLMEAVSSEKRSQSGPQTDNRTAA